MEVHNLDGTGQHCVVSSSLATSFSIVAEDDTSRVVYFNSGNAAETVSLNFTVKNDVKVGDTTTTNPNNKGIMERFHALYDTFNDNIDFQSNTTGTWSALLASKTSALNDLTTDLSACHTDMLALGSRITALSTALDGLKSPSSGACSTGITYNPPAAGSYSDAGTFGCKSS